MRAQDTTYNSWINTTYESIDVTFTDFGVPEDVIIDDIQIKLRIRTNTSGWSWFPHFSDNNGVTFYAPYWCAVSPDSCQYNTRTVFNSISSVTMTWLNTNSIKTVTGAMLNSPLFVFRLWQSTGIKNTDIDVLLFNIRYHTATPTPTSVPTSTLTPTATPTPTPTPIPEKITPLVIVPGILGSELKVAEETEWSQPDGHGGTFSHTYPKDEVVWINALEALKPGPDDYFDVLRMKSDGIASDANIDKTGELYGGVYGPTKEFFTDNGYILGENLFVFGYDWRKDISLTKSLLDQKIEEIKTQTGSDKVDILSHSMGGLVARYYIADQEKAKNVRKLFTLGTPHLGAAKFLKALTYGDCLLFEIASICLSLAQSEVKDLIQNMISGYQVAPSQGYFDFYTNNNKQYPYPFQNDSGPLNYDQIKSLLTSLGYNTGLFGPSESFHNLDDHLIHTNGVEVTNIVGSGLPTLGQIIEKTAFEMSGLQVIKKDLIFINGDQTVPLFSASISDPNRNVSLLGDADVYYTNQEHGELVSSGPALNLVRTILKNSSEIPSGVSDVPYKFSGAFLSVHSPVDIHVFDDQNRHTGPTESGDFEVNIPGSSYDTLGDAKFIFLPDDGVYAIKFEATDNGSFDFKIRKFEDSENTETVLYKDIPLTLSTIAETTFDTNSSQYPKLHVDENGDNKEDFQADYFNITHGETNYDYTSPVLSVDVTPKTIWPPNNKMTDVHITGTVSDDNLYLVKIVVNDEYDEIEPSVATYNQTDVNQTIQLKASRKEDDTDGRKYTIKVFATDQTGNTSMSSFDVFVPHDQREKK